MRVQPPPIPLVLLVVRRVLDSCRQLEDLLDKRLQHKVVLLVQSKLLMEAS